MVPPTQRRRRHTGIANPSVPSVLWRAAQAFARVSYRADIVVIHDAARPFVTDDTIRRTVAAAAETGAAIAAIAARDTVKRAGADRMVRATLPRGTLILKSTVASRPEVDLAPLVVNEITVVGSRCGSFEPALRALSSGSVEVLPLVSARVPLDRADEALRVAQQPGVLKVLVTR